MQKGSTKIWIDGKRSESVVVNRSVTDLDEAASLLGYSDYDDLMEKYNGEEVLNFHWDPSE